MMMMMIIMIIIIIIIIIIIMMMMMTMMMMMMMIMMMMIIIIIITTTTATTTTIIIVFKFEIFYNLLTAPRTVSNTYAQVARAQSCANHVQHIQRLSCATCRVTCHVVRRDSSAIKFDRV